MTKGQVLCVVEDQQYIQLQEDYLWQKQKLDTLN
jgi:cobalt-zinc-cadmium efflux system membrane fusion protein